MPAGSGTDQCDRSCSFTWTYTRVCSVNLVTLHMNLFIIYPRGELQLSVQISMASDWSISTGPPIGPGMQGQWLVQVERASDQFVFTGRVANTLCFKKVWKLCNALNICVTVGQGLPRHRRSKLGGGAFPVFVWGHRMFLQRKVKILEF